MNKLFCVKLFVVFVFSTFVANSTENLFIITGIQQGMLKPPLVIYKLDGNTQEPRIIADVAPAGGIRMAQVIPEKLSVGIWGYENKLKSDNDRGILCLINCLTGQYFVDHLPFEPISGGAMGVINDRVFCYTKPYLKLKSTDLRLQPQISWLANLSEQPFSLIKGKSMVPFLRLNGANFLREGAYSPEVEFVFNTKTIKYNDGDQANEFPFVLDENIANAIKSYKIRVQKLCCLDEKAVIFRLFGKEREQDDEKCVIIVYDVINKSWHLICANSSRSYVQYFGDHIFIQEVNRMDRKDPHSPLKFTGKYVVYSRQGVELSTWNTTPDTEILLEKNNVLYFREKDRILKSAIKDGVIMPPELIIQKDVFIDAHWLMVE